MNSPRALPEMEGDRLKPQFSRPNQGLRVMDTPIM
jgi:hypothetical protein